MARDIIKEAVRRRGRNLGVALLERFGEVGGAELPARRRAGSARAATFDE